MKLVTFILLAVGTVLVDCLPVLRHNTEGSCCKIRDGIYKFSASLKSRVYNVVNFGYYGDYSRVAQAYCDASTAGGGWLVIQRRIDGSVDFDRDWVDYENGFGNLYGEFWYGLSAIHQLTNRGQWEMRIDYNFTDGTKGFLSYSHFKVGPASTQYTLSISGFKAITNDPIVSARLDRLKLNNMKFTTRDRDHDRWSSNHNCAVHNSGGKCGGWWYNYCSDIQPNHQYNSQYTVYLNGQLHALPFIEIKIRPVVCRN